MEKQAQKAIIANTERLGLKLTKQRMAICQVFFAQKSHRTAEDILRDARVLDHNVSLATVYRTLKLLQQHGLAIAHNFTEGQSLFEPCLDHSLHHDHLICESCGKIIEFYNEIMESLQEEIASSHGFIITHHKMELYGRCKDCQ